METHMNITICRVVKNCQCRYGHADARVVNITWATVVKRDLHLTVRPAVSISKFSSSALRLPRPKMINALNLLIPWTQLPISLFRRSGSVLDFLKTKDVESPVIQ